MSKDTNVIKLSVFNCDISISINSPDLVNVFELVYGAMIVHQAVGSFKLSYLITLNKSTNEISIQREGGPQYITSDIGEFIFLFEKDMTIELQKLRSDLLFIHSAVLEYKGRGMLLVAPSGTGKSTTSWAMLNSGFNYLSDELAPIDLTTRQVQPYPHALCLKAEPPLFDLPDDCLFTSQTIHVPVRSMSCKPGSQMAPVSLDFIFFLEYDAEISEPVVSSIGLAQASAKLYSNSLNALAHDNGDKGLHVAVSLAKTVQNFSLRSNHLDKTCEKIRIMLESC